MWHNMSMIGFAIAAGQDPNALANVANGMLAGTKMMKEDRATNQAREDKIKVMAYNAEREDTKSNLDYQRNVALLGIKGANAIATAGARGAGKMVGVASNPLSQVQSATATAREQDLPESLALMAGYNELTNYSLAQMTEGAPQLLPQWQAMQNAIITTQNEVDALPDNSYFRTRDETGNIVLRQK